MLETKTELSNKVVLLSARNEILKNENSRLRGALLDCLSFMQGEISGAAQMAGIIREANAALGIDPKESLSVPQ